MRKNSLIHLTLFASAIFCACGKSSSDVTDTLPPDLNAGNWIERSDIPTVGRSRAVAFVIGNYGYVGLGTDGSKGLNDFWKYDPTQDSWSEIAPLNVKNGARIGAIAFSVNGTGYAGTGYSDSTKSLLSNFYAYDPDKNDWKKKADFPSARAYAVALSINGKGFVGTGGGGKTDANGNITGGTLKDFYQYDPSKDSWSKIADFPGTSRLGAI